MYRIIRLLALPDRNIPCTRMLTHKEYYLIAMTTTIAVRMPSLKAPHEMIPTNPGRGRVCGSFKMDERVQ